MQTWTGITRDDRSWITTTSDFRLRMLMKEGGKTAQFMQAIRFNLNYLYFVMAIIYKENSFQGIFEETLQRHRKVRYSTYSPRIFSKMLKTRIYPSN